MSAYSSYQAYPGQAPTLLEPPPVLVAVLPPQPQQRVGVFFRMILAIPHFIVLYVIGLAAAVVAFIGWWGALFTGRLPQFAVNFLSGYLRWAVRVYGYLFLLTETYPPFSFEDEPEYPVRIAVPAPQQLNRAAVFFRFILVIPVGLLIGLLAYGGFTLLAFIAWLITLFTGRLPASFHLAYTSVLRFQARYLGYYLMLTPAYPGGLYGDQPDTITWADGLDAAAAPGYGAPGGAYNPQAPGYGTPAPGYGSAVDTPPGYAGPGYGGPGYGAPGGYGTPGGYGAPAGYGAPSGYGNPGEYGAPAGYGAPVGYQPGFLSQTGMWLITLTTQAKRLITAFIVLGAIFAVVYIAVIAVGSSSAVGSLGQLTQLNDSYSTLLQKTTAADTATTNCGENMSCITKQDAALATAFSTFDSQLSSMSLPSGLSADKAQLNVDTNKLSQDFTELSQQTDPVAYNNLLSSINLDDTLNNWTSDFTKLDTDAI